MKARNTIRILLIDDEVEESIIIRDLLWNVPNQSYELEWRSHHASALDALSRSSFDICLLDYRLDQENGLELLNMIAETNRSLPVILLTGVGNHRLDLEAMRAGAADYLPKADLNSQTLERSIRYSIQTAKAKEALQESHDELEARVRKRTEELSRANEMLRLNVERLRLAHRAAGAGTWEWDLSTNENVWSEELWRLYGLEPHSCEPSYETWRSTIHPDDREHAERLVLEAARHGAPFTAEWRVIQADGKERWLRATGGPLPDSHGKLLKYLGVVQDITGPKQTEDALQKSQEEYRSLFDNMLNGFAYCEMLFEQDRPTDFVYLKVNRAFEALTGLKDVAGKKASEVIGNLQESDPQLLEVYGKVALTGTPERFEIYLKAMQMWFSVSVFSPRKKHFVAVFDVTTERKRAEELARESESHFRLLSKTATRLLEVDDPLEIVNELAREVMAELDCQTFFNFVAEDRAGKLRLNAYAGISPEEARDIEWLDYGVAICGCVARDGVRIVAEDIASNRDQRTDLVGSYGIQAYACHPLRSGGKLIGTLSFGTKARSRFSPRDLDLMKTVADQVAIAIERKRLLDALSVSEQRLALAATGARIGMFEWNIASGETYWNEQHARLLEIPTTTTTTVFTPYRYGDWAKRVHREDLARIEKQLHRCMSERAPYEAEYRIVWPDESVHWLAARGVFEYDEQGKPKYMRGIVMDITERKQAEEALRESEREYAAMFERAAVGKSWSDPAANRMLRVNKAFADMLGYSVEELCGTSFVDITYPEDRERDLAGYDLVRSGATDTWQIEKRYVRKDGSILWANTSGSIIRYEDGRPPRTIAVIQDITERKRAEEELIRHRDHLDQLVRERTAELELTNNRLHQEISERKALELEREQYYILFNTSSDLMAIFNTHTNYFLKVNPSGTHILGYSELELLEQPYSNFVHPDDLGRTYEEVQKQLIRGFTLDFENRYQRKDGSFCWLSWRATVNKESGIAYATARDITERRQMESALRASEERYRLLYQNVTDAIFIFDMNGKFISVNEQACRQYGYTQDQFQKLTIAQIDTPEDAVQIPERFAAIERDGQAAFEATHQDAQGRTLHVEAKAVKILLEDQPCIVSICRDITERKRSEDELKLFKAIVEASGQAIAISTPQGQLRYINPAHEKLFGRSLEEARKMNYREYYPPESVELLNRVVSPALDAGRGWEGELDVFDADGRRFPLWERADTLSDASGKALYFFGLMYDVTERKQAEEQKIELEHRLHQIQKSESLGRMAGAIAHNFNNMLGAVIGNLDLAQDDAPDGSELQTCIKEAMDASQRAANISRFMLTYLGQTEGKSEHIDPAAAIREACSLLSPSIPNNVRLKADIPSRGHTVKADGAHLTQILTNLIENSIEAIGEEEGEIALTLDTVPGADLKGRKLFPLDWEATSEEYARISITDTGRGIDPDQLDKIFDPFFSTRFAGRGLGLAVVLGLLRTADGAIEVESHPGRGADFKVLLPLSERARPVPVKEESPVIKHVAERGSILVVDDEDTVRNMAGAMLKRKLGYDVVTARDGFQALEIFSARKDEFSLVILDLSMPGMNGWETLAALRKIRPDLPVILSSGYDEAQVCRGEHEERPQAFLPKPYGAKELKAALDAAFQ